MAGGGGAETQTLLPKAGLGVPAWVWEGPDAAESPKQQPHTCSPLGPHQAASAGIPLEAPAALGVGEEAGASAAPLHAEAPTLASSLDSVPNLPGSQGPGASSFLHTISSSRSITK